MNKDFHHGVIYVLSRLAGFNPEQSSIIAYSSQYVDDACNRGVISFSNNIHAKYYHISSSQDINVVEGIRTYFQDDVYNEHVWVPFHFLPGNAGRTVDEGDEDLSFVDKLICKPNSPVAKDMVDECIRRRDDNHALYRLGITMHVYADTWAHQEFIGLKDQTNDVDDIDTDTWSDIPNRVAAKALPLLGHGRAMHFPDYPFLSNWSYTNGLGKRITRNNHADFVDAATNIFKVLQTFLSPNEPIRDFSPSDLDQITLMLRDTTSSNENDRHAAWLNNIRDGAFSFGPETPPSYPPEGKGIGSWKYDALGTEDKWDTVSEFVFEKSFLTSNWKLFHDALQSHRFYVLHELLPKYGILCCLPG